MRCPNTPKKQEQHHADRWPQKIPKRFAQKMKEADSSALAKQVRYDPAEQTDNIGFSTDPVGDREAHLGDGLLIKYHGRALLLTTLSCAIHCRFCFRRAFSNETMPTAETRRLALQKVSKLPDIQEIILSGGDPLMLNNQMLKSLFEQIEAIPHIERMRIHSRMITVAPERIDETLCDHISKMTKQVIFVTHVNHPNELDNETRDAVARLKSIRTASPTLILNQSVLLRGVNDNADCLIALSKKLVAQGILPYYLHQLDKVVGSSHFEVPVEKGRTLIETMRQRCPGYMVPKYVREQPTEPSKTPL